MAIQRRNRIVGVGGGGTSDIDIDGYSGITATNSGSNWQVGGDYILTAISSIRQSITADVADNYYLVDYTDIANFDPATVSGCYDPVLGRLVPCEDATGTSYTYNIQDYIPPDESTSYFFNDWVTETGQTSISGHIESQSVHIGSWSNTASPSGMLLEYGPADDVSIGDLLVSGSLIRIAGTNYIDGYWNIIHTGTNSVIIDTTWDESTSTPETAVFSLVTDARLYTDSIINFFDMESRQVYYVDPLEVGINSIQLDSAHEPGEIVSIVWATSSGYSPPRPPEPLPTPSGLTLPSGHFYSQYSTLYTFGKTAFYDVVANENKGDGEIYYMVTTSGWNTAHGYQVFKDGVGWHQAVKIIDTNSSQYWNNDTQTYQAGVGIDGSIASALEFSYNRMTAADLAAITKEQWLLIFKPIQQVKYVKMLASLWSTVSGVRPSLYNYSYKTDSVKLPIWAKYWSGGSAACIPNKIVCRMDVKIENEPGFIIPNKDIKMWISLTNGASWQQVLVGWDWWSTGDWVCPDGHVAMTKWSWGVDVPYCDGVNISDKRYFTLRARSFYNYSGLLQGTLEATLWKRGAVDWQLNKADPYIQYLKLAGRTNSQIITKVWVNPDKPYIQILNTSAEWACPTPPA